VGAEIATATTSRAESVALHRAVRKLTRLGLIHVGHTPRGMSRVRTAWLSTLGEALAGIFGDAWRRGDRVRWDGRVLAAVRQVEHSPRELLAEARSSLKAKLAENRSTWRLHGMRIQLGDSDATALYELVERAEEFKDLLAAIDAASAHTESDPARVIPPELSNGDASAFERGACPLEPTAVVLAERRVAVE
jgi:hypothetical protein